jgi:hypothetical protein
MRYSEGQGKSKTIPNQRSLVVAFGAWHQEAPHIGASVNGGQIHPHLAILISKQSTNTPYFRGSSDVLMLSTSVTPLTTTPLAMAWAFKVRHLH